MFKKTVFLKSMLQPAFPVALLQKMILANFLKTIGCLGGAQLDFSFWRHYKKGKKILRKTPASNISPDAEWPPES